MMALLKKRREQLQYSQHEFDHRCGFATGHTGHFEHVNGRSARTPSWPTFDVLLSALGLELRIVAVAEPPRGSRDARMARAAARKRKAA